MSNLDKKNKILEYMQGFALKNNNLEQYTSLHYSTAFASIVLLCGVVCLAIYADFSVLYAINYNINRDFWKSLAIAATGSGVIQALLLFGGFQCIKLAINGKHAFKWKTISRLKQEKKYKEAKLLRDNAIMWGLYLSLTITGLCATGYLSLQTDSRAKAEAHYTEAEIKASILSNQDSIRSVFSQKKTELIRKYVDDTTAIAAQYDAIIAAAAPQLHVSKQGYENKKSSISAKKYHASINYLNYLISDAEKKPREQRAAALLQKRQQFSDNMDALEKSLEKALLNAQSDLDKESLHSDLNVAAFATRGLNIMYNGISLLLTALLLFFARGANIDMDNAVLTTIPINTVNNNPDTDLHFEQLIEHNNKMYNKRQVEQFIKTYRSRAKKALDEGKIDVAKNNRQQMEYWQKRLEEFV